MQSPPRRRWNFGAANPSYQWMGIGGYDLQLYQGAPRLERLPHLSIQQRLVPVALGLRARLLGLVGLDRDEVGDGLLIPRCASVHTFGMRFNLDVAFLDSGGDVLVWYLDVPPRRMVRHRGAYAALEVPAGSLPGPRSLDFEHADSLG